MSAPSLFIKKNPADSDFSALTVRDVLCRHGCNMAGPHSTFPGLPLTDWTRFQKLLIVAQSAPPPHCTLVLCVGLRGNKVEATVLHS